MEKLMELLQEYPQDIAVEDLDSLKVLRGFIKWLVENDKIDINKTPGHYIYHYTDEDVVKEALMHLAIQDEPIKFLCDMLKDDATEEVDTLLKGIKKSCESLGL